MKRLVALNLVFGIVALFLGFCIYILFRENTYIAKCFSEKIPFEIIRMQLSFLNIGFLKFYMVDYLWAFSFACFMKVAFGESERFRIWQSGIVFLSGVIYEALQFGKVISGTGDIVDIGLYLLAVLTVWGINYILIRRCRK